jgi:DnaJ-class molecular chaperone
MKDYYSILGVSPQSLEEEIRIAYRRLALKNHPDRNPNDPSAEERFKSISEAYGVLIDPDKRRQYDLSRSWDARKKRKYTDFRYSQEEILRDLFRNPNAYRIFQDIFAEFEQEGVRFDKHFFDRVLFGGRGILFGGVFVWGPFGVSRDSVPRAKTTSQVPRAEKKHAPGLIERFGQKLGQLLLGKPQANFRGIAGTTPRSIDLHYHLSIPGKDFRRGTKVRIAIDRGKGQERLNVRIPTGTKPGTRLRLKGKGILEGGVSGDLYITVHGS